MNNRIDFIGDIHGHADQLEALLRQLGYALKNGCYAHPERIALFVGDYIDRGPQIRETLRMVRSMVEGARAIALLGNHEYNAMCFHFPEKEGGHLRKHKINNILQHYQTLLQFQNRQGEYEDYLDWCKTLPLYYETDDFRAVHACWSARHIETLRKMLIHDRLNEELIFQSVRKESPLHTAVEETLKGREMTMPDGLHFTDKDGTIRREIRIKWWEDLSSTTYRNSSVESLDSLPDIPLDRSLLAHAEYYHPEEKPVFFGHYWLKGQPQVYRNNVCCLDFSVAKQGYLAAYRWNGEARLSNNNWVFV